MVLEQLFGSETRYKLLQIFVKNPEKTFFVRELVRQTNGHIHAVRRELANLEHLGIIRSIDMPNGANPWGDSAPSDKKKKFYTFAPGCFIFEELKSLFAKDAQESKAECIKELGALTCVDYLLVSGVFTNEDHASIDVLIVGSPHKEAVGKIMHECENAFARELRYTIMSSKEFLYRRDVVDRFIYDIIDKKHTILVDKLPETSHV